MYWDRYPGNILCFSQIYVYICNDDKSFECFTPGDLCASPCSALLYQHVIWLLLNFKSTFVMMISLLYDVFQEGFVYHHAEPDYIMLTYWIPESPSTLPANASHQVGVGAIVINDKNEVYNHSSLHCAEDRLFFSI